MIVWQGWRKYGTNSPKPLLSVLRSSSFLLFGCFEQTSEPKPQVTHLYVRLIPDVPQLHQVARLRKATRLGHNNRQNPSPNLPCCPLLPHRRWSRVVGGFVRIPGPRWKNLFVENVFRG